MNKGFVLVLMVFLLVGCSLIAMVAFLLSAQATTEGLGFLQAVQAQAIAVAGRQWYLRQLADDTDWTDQAPQTDIALNPGSFNIDIVQRNGNDVSFTVKGRLPGYLNQTIQRQERLAAKKLPKACNFGLFWQQDGPGARLNLSSSGAGTQITGDFWSVGSVNIPAGCVVTDGTVYYGSGETVSGAGSYQTQAVSSPFPPMPELDNSEYDALMNQYDGDIASNHSSASSYQSGLIELNGNTLEFRNFRTRNNLVIRGYGKIVASRDVLLHYGEGSGIQNLSIEPEPGQTIEILAGRNFRINNQDPDYQRIVTINPGTIMYAGGTSSANLFQINAQGDTYYTDIRGGLILARRRLMVRQGARVTESRLYLDYASNNANNLLLIRDGNTVVSGMVISRGRNSPSLRIRAGALVSGLVYQYGDASLGQAQVDGNSAVNGTLIVRQFYNNSLGPAIINQDLDLVLSFLPQGLDGFVLTQRNSWDDH